MSESTISPILALASLVALTGSTALALGAGAPGAHQLRAFLLRYGRWAAFAVAATATLGSLYYSEVANFVPCEFCWYQRIAMYPLAPIGLAAAVTRDRAAKYMVPLAAIGLTISIYHYQLEIFPNQASACSSLVPCNVRVMEEFGFVSIPFMAGCGFLAILMLHLGAWRARRFEGETGAEA